MLGRTAAMAAEAGGGRGWRCRRIASEAQARRGACVEALCQSGVFMLPIITHMQLSVKGL